LIGYTNSLTSWGKKS